MAGMKDIKEVVREAEGDGWSVTRNGRRLRFVHPLARSPVFSGSDAGLENTVHNLRAKLKRALPKPEKPTLTIAAKPKAKPQPQPAAHLHQTTAPPRPRPPLQTHHRAAVEGELRFRPSELRAFALAAVRLRINGQDWSTVRIMRTRFRRDDAFRATLVTAYLTGGAERFAALRAKLRGRHPTPEVATPPALPAPPPPPPEPPTPPGLSDQPELDYAAADRFCDAMLRPRAKAPPRRYRAA